MSFGDLFSSSTEDQKVKGPKPLSGTHLLALTSVKMQKTRNVGRMAEFRFVVLKTTNPEMAVGSECVEPFFPENTKDPDTLEANRGRLRAMVRAIAKLPNNAAPEEVSEAWEAMVDETQPARGVKVRCTGTDLESKKGNAFVACTYEAVTQSDEDIKATRAQIESVSFEAKAEAAMKPEPKESKPSKSGLPPALAARFKNSEEAPF